MTRARGSKPTYHTKNIKKTKNTHTQTHTLEQQLSQVALASQPLCGLWPEGHALNRKKMPRKIFVNCRIASTK